LAQTNQTGGDMKAKLIQLVSWLRAFVPVILRYIPGLAAWSAVIYVIIDLVLWLLRHF
jgi:hypothetical protein